MKSCPDTIFKLYSGPIKVLTNTSVTFKGGLAMVEGRDRNQVAGLELAKTFPSPRLCLGTVIALAIPFTSTLSWYCHCPRHSPHLDSVLVLSSPSTFPSPRLCEALSSPPCHSPHLDAVLVLSSPSPLPFPSPRFCLGTVVTSQHSLPARSLAFREGSIMRVVPMTMEDQSNINNEPSLTTA
jgi:hypothetical protein